MIYDAEIKLKCFKASSEVSINSELKYQTVKQPEN